MQKIKHSIAEKKHFFYHIGILISINLNILILINMKDHFSGENRRKRFFLIQKEK